MEKKVSKAQKIFTEYDPVNASEEVLKFVKSSFETGFDTAVKIQDLNEKAFKDWLDKGKEVQADAVLMVNDFIENAKKGRDEYRKVVDNGFNKIEEVLKMEK